MNKKWILSCLEEGVITIPSFLLQDYKKIGLTDTECMLLLHIHGFLEKGKLFPTHDELSDRMHLSVDQCSETLSSLIQRGYLLIEKDYSNEGIYYEKYSLRPLWEKLIDYKILQEKSSEKEEMRVEEESLYTIFEQEFGRPLSPIECETMTMWVDQDKHSAALIKAALREAVLSGKLNFRYIDRILFEWKKNGIKTVKQAEEQGKKFRIHQQQQKTNRSEKKKTGTAPLYNWLEN